MTQIRITVRNTSETGGTFLTPTYFGFHDGSFDLFDAGEAASPGLESLAEDGSAATLAGERLAADADSQGIVVAGAAGPIATQETATGIIDVDGTSNGFVSLAAMILPSNDAFIGTDEAVQIFDENGEFLGEQTLVFEGSDVYDAGTEVNTERDAAFINQTGPNTGVDENGVVGLHPGFNGSEGNPVGEGDQIILGGTNAFGVAITEEADFTREGAQVATVHINTVVFHTGTDGRDIIRGRDDDDIVNAGGGNDRIITRDGWDEIHAGDGRDRVFAGDGDDILNGGAGKDNLFGGRGNDTFIFETGNEHDQIRDFNRFAGDKDQIIVSVAGVEDIDDLFAYSVNGTRAAFSFGNGDFLNIRNTTLDDLSEEDFIFLPPVEELIG